MFFSKGRLPINLNFKMNKMELEIVSEFIYMGTMFQRTGSFKRYPNHLDIARTETNISPCLTPFKHGKIFETESL
jgi:hypothetical protein